MNRGVFGCPCHYLPSCLAVIQWFSQISHPCPSPPSILPPEPQVCVCAPPQPLKCVAASLAWVDVAEHGIWHITVVLNHQCECLCVLSLSQPFRSCTHTHPLTPPSQCWLVATATVSPLFLMLLWDSDRQTWAEWQCVCGSGKRPIRTNKRRSRPTLPRSVMEEPGDFVCLGRQESSPSYRSRGATQFLLFLPQTSYFPHYSWRVTVRASRLTITVVFVGDNTMGFIDFDRIKLEQPEILNNFYRTNQPTSENPGFRTLTLKKKNPFQQFI